MSQQEALHPVLHVLQHPAVGQFVPGSLHSQPVQTLGRVVLDHLTRRTHKDTHAQSKEVLLVIKIQLSAIDQLVDALEFVQNLGKILYLHFHAFNRVFKYQPKEMFDGRNVLNCF